MTLYRPHRGTLVESIRHVQEVTTLQDIPIPEFVEPTSELEIAPYGFAARINWDTHIVTLKSGGVLGFTNGKLI